jgi:chaperonin GroES
MPMNIRPLQDRVIVKRIEGQDKTEGGLFIPDVARERPVEGMVVAAGRGRVLDDGRVQPLDVKPGDKVLFAKFAGTEVKWAGEEHLMMKEEDILAIVES